MHHPPNIRTGGSIVRPREQWRKSNQPQPWNTRESFTAIWQRSMMTSLFIKSVVIFELQATMNAWLPRIDMSFRQFIRSPIPMALRGLHWRVFPTKAFTLNLFITSVSHQDHYIMMREIWSRSYSLRFWYLTCRRRLSEHVEILQHASSLRAS